MRERDIFIEAVQKATPAEVDAYLAGACGGDVTLRGRVDALLAEHRRQESFILDAPPAGVGATVGPPDVRPPASAESPGARVGPYELVDQIGEGGMGVVFAAEQHAPVRRRVALKVIRAGMDTRQVVARFDAERQALALMDHPNIARVFDAGATDAGRPYFVMELVEGVPITAYCDAHRLTARERLELFVQVCQAVQHAHQKGVIHRDIKPSNVLVALYDGRPVPKVIDFGVAKATGGRLTEQTLLTGSAQMVGTPPYMSPEQVGHGGVDVDTRSDVYSLGVLMYELLTGTTPFDQARLGRAAYDEVRRIIREEEPPKPSTRLSDLGRSGDTGVNDRTSGPGRPAARASNLASVSALRHTEPAKLTRLVRGELDWIVMRCLEKDRDRRYETATGLAMDVDRYLADEPVHACPPTRAYRLRKFGRRHKGPLAAAAALAATLVVATVVSAWQAARASRALGAEIVARRDADAARQRADAEAGRATTAAATAAAIAEFLDRDLLAQADPYLPFDRYHQPWTDRRLVTVLHRAAGRLQGRFADQPLVEAALRQTIGQTYMTLFESGGAGNPARVHFERACDLRRRHLGAEDPATLVSMECLGVVTNDRDLLTRVVDARRRVRGKDDPQTLGSVFALAGAMRESGEPARAVELFRELLAAQRRLFGIDDPRAAWTEYCLARTLVTYAAAAGGPPADDREIESMYRHALKVYRTKSAAAWQTYDVHLRLAEFLNRRGRYPDAESVLQEGLLLLAALPGAPGQIAAGLTEELDRVYANWGRPDRSPAWQLRWAAHVKFALLRTSVQSWWRETTPESERTGNQ